jgi:hypothetical protein
LAPPFVGSRRADRKDQKSWSVRMVETKVEIRFAGPDEARATVQSTVQGDAAKQAEILLFCHYAVRVLRRLANGESAAPLVQSLAALEGASSEDAVRLAEEAAGGDVGNPGQDAIAGAGKRLLIGQRLLSARRSPRIHLSAKARGFGLLRQGLDHAFSRSLLLLFSSLVERRAGDTGYVRRLARAGASVGRLAQADPAVLANEVGVALAAADAGWQVAVGEDLARSGDARMHAAIECPACRTRAATRRTDRSFDARLWPDATATLARCGHCGSGVWAADGTARVITPDAWNAMESIRSWLLDETEQHPNLSLFEKLKAVFTEEGWAFSEIQPLPVLLTELDGPSGTWKLYAHAVEERELILLYSICPLTVPPEKRAEMASFLTRANYGLALGNFELDFEDGEIRYKTSLTVEGGDVRATLVRRLARVNGLAMERYLPSIAAVVTGTPALPDIGEQRGG